MSYNFKNARFTLTHIDYCNPSGYGEHQNGVFKIIFLFIFCARIFCPNNCEAQSSPDYDEVSITLQVQRIGEIEISSLVSDQKAYLPVSDIFDFLHIKNAVSLKMDSISGFFINPSSKFIIDKPHNRIVYADKIYDLPPGDLISTTTNLYLRSDYFGKIFGLNCAFSFRNLSVIVSTELELPAIREMRQEQMRANVNKLTGVVKADTTIGRTYPLFHFGTADYSVFNSTYSRGGLQDTRVGLGLGGIIAGGETNIVFNYDNQGPFVERQQYYLWRYVNNDNPMVKQISLGKIYGQSISSIYAPIVGIQVTNTPTTFRRSFGTYTLSNFTEPNWVVELYVNGILITYVKADASGSYTFNVPLVYGNSVVKLRFYGPYGEERSSEQNISLPFNFLPKNEFEYTETTGLVEDGYQSLFSRFSSNYGLTKIITIGGGTEYLSSITSGTTIPFANTSVRILPNMFFSGEYDYGVQKKAILNYNLSSGMQLEIDDIWYKQGQTAISNTYLEDRKAILSFPVRSQSFSAYSRITVEQIILATSRYTTAQWLLSSVFGNYSTSINTYGLFFDNGYPYVYSDFSISTRIFKNALLTQQLQYEYTERKIAGIKTELEKKIFKNGYLNVSYEKNFSTFLSDAEIGLRYDFSFAQAGASVRKSNNATNYLQSVNGSLIYDNKVKLTDFNNINSVGTGAIIIIPYLDLNGNGKRDAGEPGAPGLKVRINGGRVKQNIKDTTIRITNLEAYTKYNVELDPSGFDKVAWQLPKKTYAVIIDPNLVKRIEVPVLVSGEAAGSVVLKNNDDEKGLGRMTICFYNNKSVLIAHTVTEIDGYFTYLGLLPGTYTVRIDTTQLTKLRLVSITGSLAFTIILNNDGSIVDGLNFVVKSAEEPPITKDSTNQKTKLKKKKNESLPVDTNGFTTQITHLNHNEVLRVQEYLKKYNYRVIILMADKGFYNIRIIGVTDLKEAKTLIKTLKKIRHPGVFRVKHNTNNVHNIKKIPLKHPLFIEKTILQINLVEQFPHLSFVYENWFF